MRWLCDLPMKVRSTWTCCRVNVLRTTITFTMEMQWGIQDFPGRRSTPKFGAKTCDILKQIYLIQTSGVGASLAPTLDPPMKCQEFSCPSFWSQFLSTTKLSLVFILYNFIFEVFIESASPRWKYKQVRKQVFIVVFEHLLRRRVLRNS